MKEDDVFKLIETAVKEYKDANPKAKTVFVTLKGRNAMLKTSANINIDGKIVQLLCGIDVFLRMYYNGVFFAFNIAPLRPDVKEPNGLRKKYLEYFLPSDVKEIRRGRKIIYGKENHEKAR